MIGSIRDWFQALSGREKILIAALGLLIIGTIGFYGIFQPFQDAIENALNRHQIATERHARIATKVAALTGKEETKITTVDGPVVRFISQSAGETGFAVGKIDPQSGGRVNMTIESAKPTALFGWLSQLEARGVLLEALAVNPAGDGTVSVTLTLHSRATK